MTSTFPSAPDNIAPLNVTNATAERDVHPLLHNQLASAVNAIETYLAPGGAQDVGAHSVSFDPHPFYVLKTGGTMNGSLLFSPNNTHDIGATSTSKPRSIYAGTSVVTPLVTTNLVATASSDLTIRATTNASINFETNNLPRWSIQATRLTPTADNGVFDIGANSTRPLNLYLYGYLDVRQIATPANPSAGNMRLYCKADGKFYMLTSAGVETALT